MKAKTNSNTRYLGLVAALATVWLLSAAPTLAAGRSSASPVRTAELVLPDAASGGESAALGTAAALSADGKTAILGAPRRTVYDRQSGEGDAYTLKAKGWSTGHELTLGAPAGNGSFVGQSVAVSGDGKTALIGAPQRGIVGAGQAGAAYLYTRNNGSWGTAVRFNLGAKAAYGDQYGFSVALSGNGKTALIGAPYRTAAGVAFAGAGEIYTFSGGTWNGPMELNLGKHGSGYLGYSVALSANGHIALLGAPQRGDDGATEVFTLSKGGWHKTAELHLPSGTTAQTPSFGYSVALNAKGTTALVGAVGQTVHNVTTAGGAEAFVYKSGKWRWKKELNLGSHAGETDNLGAAVSLNAAGTRALVGVPRRTVDGTAVAGAAELFALSHGQWGKPVQLSMGKKAVQGDNFGTSVALSGTGSTALIGVPGRTVGHTPTGAGEVFNIH